MPEQEKVEEKPEEQKEDFESKWDTERQEKEQAKANYAKVVAEKEVVSEQLTSQQATIAELEKQITAKKEDSPYPEIDSDLVDGNVIKSIQQMRAELKEAKQELGKLQGVAKTYQTKEEQRDAKAYQDLLIEKMCKPLDEEFGVKHRNAAKALADKLVDEGKEPKPADAIDAMLLMRKCYGTVSKSTDKKEPVRTDDGSGGMNVSSGKRKAGTNDEIFAEMRQDASWKEDPIREVV